MFRKKKKEVVVTDLADTIEAALRQEEDVTGRVSAFRTKLVAVASITKGLEGNVSQRLGLVERIIFVSETKMKEAEAALKKLKKLEDQLEAVTIDSKKDWVGEDIPEGDILLGLVDKVDGVPLAEDELDNVNSDIQRLIDRKIADLEETITTSNANTEEAKRHKMRLENLLVRCKETQKTAKEWVSLIDLPGKWTEKGLTIEDLIETVEESKGKKKT